MPFNARIASGYSWTSGEYDEDGLSGEPMKFRLVYEGPLVAAKPGKQRPKEKHAIRRVFHAQLKKVWDQHVGLRGLKTPVVGQQKSDFEILADAYQRCDRRFVPLVSERMSLVCRLDILFLRRQDPGNVIEQRGDLDNRLKTLFDAFTVPVSCEGVAAPTDGEDPFYCLLQDDKLITGFNVVTDRLHVDARSRDLLPGYYGVLETDQFESPGEGQPTVPTTHHEENDVLLIILVEVYASRVGLFNMDLIF